MGLSGLEPPTSRLSGVRSNQLSYKPSFPKGIRPAWRTALKTKPCRPPGSPVKFLIVWQPPALPHRPQCSTIGRLCLNRRVRDGYGCFP